MRAQRAHRRTRIPNTTIGFPGLWPITRHRRRGSTTLFPGRGPSRTIVRVSPCGRSIRGRARYETRTDLLGRNFTQPARLQQGGERTVLFLDRNDVEHSDELAGAEHQLVAGSDVIGVCSVAGFAAVRVVQLAAEQRRSSLGLMLSD
jgi:hypothetical protein